MPTFRSDAGWRLAVLLVLTALLIPVQPVYACSCIYPDLPSFALIRSDAVFTGTVTKVVSSGKGVLPSVVEPVRRWLGLPPAPGAYGRRVSVQVSDSWKGVTAGSIEVHTGNGDADCGYRFTPGRQYLIYAHRDEAGLATNICTRTVELASAGTDLAYLQTLPQLPLTPGAAVSDLPLLLGGLLAAGGLLSFLLWRRAHRHSL